MHAQHSAHAWPLASASLSRRGCPPRRRPNPPLTASLAAPPPPPPHLLLLPTHPPGPPPDSVITGDGGAPLSYYEAVRRCGASNMTLAVFRSWAELDSVARPALRLLPFLPQVWAHVMGGEGEWGRGPRAELGAEGWGLRMPAGQAGLWHLRARPSAFGHATVVDLAMILS